MVIPKLYKKKTPTSRGLFGLLNQVFPCFHFFRKPLLHTKKVCHLFHYCGRLGWNVTKLSYVTVVYFKRFWIKKYNNNSLERRVFTYKKLVCEELLIYIAQWQKVSDLQYYLLIFFSNIDKDLKTCFLVSPLLENLLRSTSILQN